MNEQFTFPGFEPPEHQEYTFLSSIFAKMKNAVDTQGGEPEDLLYDKTENYTKVEFSGYTVFRLRLRGKVHYISVPITFEDLIPDSFPQKRMKSESEMKYIRISINLDHPVDMYTDFLVKISGETVNRFPKEWDCCSRYIQCSDAKACVHPDRREAIRCGYRKILHSGKIFYGKNRNVD